MRSISELKALKRKNHKIQIPVYKIRMFYFTHSYFVLRLRAHTYNPWAPGFSLLSLGRLTGVILRQVDSQGFQIVVSACCPMLLLLFNFFLVLVPAIVTRQVSNSLHQ